MRTNLILHLHCSECGKRLNLCYKNELKKKPVKPGYKEVDDEPTGAACYYPDPIVVEPCKSCIEKYTLPAKQLCESIKTLNSTKD